MHMIRLGCFEVGGRLPVAHVLGIQISFGALGRQKAKHCIFPRTLKLLFCVIGRGAPSAHTQDTYVLAKISPSHLRKAWSTFHAESPSFWNGRAVRGMTREHGAAAGVKLSEHPSGQGLGRSPRGGQQKLQFTPGRTPSNAPCRELSSGVE